MSLFVWYFGTDRTYEDVEHLYFAGAGMHPGAGIPGVLSPARVLDTIVPEPEEFEVRTPTPVVA